MSPDRCDVHDVIIVLAETEAKIDRICSHKLKAVERQSPQNELGSQCCKTEHFYCNRISVHSMLNLLSCGSVGFSSICVCMSSEWTHTNGSCRHWLTECCSTGLFAQLCTEIVCVCKQPCARMPLILCLSIPLSTISLLFWLLPTTSSAPHMSTPCQCCPQDSWLIKGGKHILHN